MSRRVVVTGLGVITPLGTGVEKTWEGALAGRSGISLIDRWDASRHDTKFAGQVRDFNAEDWIEKKEIRRNDPYCLYGFACTEMALRQSGLETNLRDPTRVGVIIGSGIGGIQALEHAYSVLLEKGPQRISAFFIPAMIANMASGLVTIKHGFKGANWAPVSACATGAHAIGEAFEYIRRGAADAMVCGGAEATITPLAVAGFNSMKALSTNNEHYSEASRPFDKDRDGFVMAEGAGILVIEALEFAKARGATILCELIGYGATSDAYHITMPAPEGVGAAQCMKAALADAKIDSDQVGYVNAHGTSTLPNDANETMAIKTVFGSHARKLAISSTKSMTGHMLGAAGGAEAAFCVLAIQRGVLPPTINYKTKDPDCDLDYVPNQARETKVQVAISNSFGFGGTNAVLAFRRFQG
jgi:3-oxoacyl-[acyl-carrier-protein] synthase II